MSVNHFFIEIRNVTYFEWKQASVGHSGTAWKQFLIKVGFLVTCLGVNKIK